MDGIFRLSAPLRELYLCFLLVAHRMIAIEGDLWLPKEMWWYILNNFFINLRARNHFLTRQIQFDDNFYLADFSRDAAHYYDTALLQGRAIDPDIYVVGLFQSVKVYDICGNDVTARCNVLTHASIDERENLTPRRSCLFMDDQDPYGYAEHHPVFSVDSPLKFVFDVFHMELVPHLFLKHHYEDEDAVLTEWLR